MPENKDHWSTGPVREPQPAPPPIHTPRLTRTIALVRGFTGVAGVVSMAVFVAEAKLPDAYKPSMVIGSFHGRIEAADANAKIEAMAALARRNAEATAQPPAFATMESEAFRQQQLVLTESLQTQSGIANFADAGCAGGQLIPRGNPDLGWLGDFLRGLCGVGDEVRQNMVGILKRGGQDNSVLIQRPRAGGESR